MTAMLRSILVSAVFEKMTEISIAKSDNSAAVTLMSTDVGVIEIHSLRLLIRIGRCNHTSGQTST
jgi:hypothetical protein